jgi:hypothetical protein
MHIRQLIVYNKLNFCPSLSAIPTKDLGETTLIRNGLYALQGHQERKQRQYGWGLVNLDGAHVGSVLRGSHTTSRIPITYFQQSECPVKTRASLHHYWTVYLNKYN